jgi:hypothetical protein
VLHIQCNKWDKVLQVQTKRCYFGNNPKICVKRFLYNVHLYSSQQLTTVESTKVVIDGSVKLNRA